MALLNILQFPDPRLRKVALPVATVDDEIQRLIDDMLETLYEGRGVGLAATQVNVHRRVIVVDASQAYNEPICLINPEIIHREGSRKMSEGCLSVPGIYEEVERAITIRVKALDRQGTSYEFDADGLLGHCIQHEVEHLDGKLFIDRLSPLKRKLILKKLEKNRRRAL